MGDEYPFEAVQVWTSKVRTAPPFLINRIFVRALAKACRRFGIPKIKNLKTVRPPGQLLREIAKEMRAASR